MFVRLQAHFYNSMSGHVQKYSFNVCRSCAIEGVTIKERDNGAIGVVHPGWVEDDE